MLTLQYTQDRGAIGLTKTNALKRVFVHWAFDLLDDADADVGPVRRGGDVEDPKRLGARVGMTSVLHTWGSTRAPPRRQAAGGKARQLAKTIS